ncbi:O-antigen ligase family protein [Microbacterium sp. RG1]|uniref:O-antigen ligase family protein n=1 Tax=Microbacterium sp. RG1 TaxID=2489212 RepID=UPI00137643A0|nr:O-antigen ligase family protein [Microbacterium sp. RG1]
MIVGLLVAISYAEIPPVVFVQEVVRVAIILAIVSWLMVPVLPHVAVLPDITWRLNGPMQHSQRLALVAGFALLLGLAMMLRSVPFLASRRRELGALVLLGLTLAATQTRANTAFVLIICVILVFFRIPGWTKIFAVLAAGLIIWYIVANFDELLASVGRDGSNTMTLTGRTVIWTNAISMIEVHPVFGYGFASFFSPLTAHFFSSGYVAPHAHNTWINATFETGLVGSAILSVFLLGALLSDRGSKLNSGYVWPTVLFAMLCGLMGIVYGGKIGTFWVLITIMVAQATHQRLALKRGAAFDASELLLTPRRRKAMSNSRIRR